MEKFFEDSFDEATEFLKQTIFLRVVTKLSAAALFITAESNIQMMKDYLLSDKDQFKISKEESLAISYESLFSFGLKMSIGETMIDNSSYVDSYLKELKDLMVRKQKDYGKDNILKFGHTGLMVRMSDKIERIKNLVSKGKTPQNESLDDSYRDIVNYAIIGTMLLQDTFTRPLRED